MEQVNGNGKNECVGAPVQVEEVKVDKLEEKKNYMKSSTTTISISSIIVLTRKT